MWVRVCVRKRKHVGKAHKKECAGKSEETKGRDGMGKKASTRAWERASPRLQERKSERDKQHNKGSMGHEERMGLAKRMSKLRESEWGRNKENENEWERTREKENLKKRKESSKGKKGMWFYDSMWEKEKKRLQELMQGRRKEDEVTRMSCQKGCVDVRRYLRVQEKECGWGKGNERTKVHCCTWDCTSLCGREIERGKARWWGAGQR